MSERRERSAAEWVSFAVSLAIVLFVLGLLTVEAGDSDRPADPRASVSGPVEKRGGRFHIPVTVHNNGDETAENVQVRVTLDIDEESTDGDQTVDFLAGAADADLVFVFDDDPKTGDLTVEVTGFTVP